MSATNFLPATSQANDAQLVSLILQRNVDAFEQLYDKYAPALFTVILTKIHDREQASVVLHDVMLHIWANISTYDDQSSRLITWMHAVTRKFSDVDSNIQQIPEGVMMHQPMRVKPARIPITRFFKKVMPALLNFGTR